MTDTTGVFMEMNDEKRGSWLDRPLLTTFTLNWEIVIFSLIFILFIITRFYELGVRVMSHDESLHTYYSWLLYSKGDFQHTPLMHGPLQFHLIALAYFLFGDSDFTARIPAALASILCIPLLWQYRRYLGRAGTLVAGALFLISPYLLYYGRYVRNEALVVPLGLITIWSILRYMESSENRYLYYLTAATVLHFTAKETAFIYTAQALLFLAIYFVNRVTRRPWPEMNYRRLFSIALVIAFAFLTIAGGSILISRSLGTIGSTETAAPAIPGEDQTITPSTVPSVLTIAMGMLALIAFAIAAVLLIRGYSWNLIRKERSFDLVILLSTLVLPQLAPFLVRAIGWDPLDYSYTGMLRTAAFLVPFVIFSIGIGLWWKPRVWLISGAIFYAIFVVFYTTIFTNGQGFFTGIVGSLGYWLEQQGVQRGSQPSYYYLLVQLPIYEYLPALGSLLALYLGIKTRKKSPAIDPSDSSPNETQQEFMQWEGEIVVEGETEQEENIQPVQPLALIGFWAISSLLAYTVAGEKMPWLTVHLTWPMILLSGWAIGHYIETTDWSAFREQRGYWAFAVLAVFLTSVSASIASILGTNPPLQGRELEQLQATSTFLTSLVTAIVSGWGLIYLMRPWRLAQVGRVLTISVFAFLGILTARAGFVATYINYDNAQEYLVYAHGARGVKDILDQVEEISRRTTDGLALQVAYDDSVSWPFTWYLRNYTNQRYYAKNPTRDLRDVPVVLVGTSNYAAVEPIVGQAFYRFEYIRMVWPDQDYFNLTPDRVLNAIRDREMRSALFQIWLNRDYTKYTEVVNKDLSLPNWSPSDKMRMYVRKDVATKLWNYGVGPASEDVVADPYEGGGIELLADKILGGEGRETGLFQGPNGLAVGPDGSLYVADSQNHRIQHLSPEGEVLDTWGSFADIAQGTAPEGFFNEPWGIAVGPDGSVFVADTWNHRIQKFTPEGDFLAMWGYFGQAEAPTAFWGPRDIAVDNLGRVLVADTGNKRIVVFDDVGNYISEIGEVGFGLAQFDEPTGVTVNNEGLVFVADTWNQRVQSLQLSAAGDITPFTTWDIVGWYSQSLENKPYITVDERDHVFISDPEGHRILEFTDQGEFVRFWGDFGSGPGGFTLVTGLAADREGGIWVSDAGQNRLMHFTLPAE
jgi:uncharacterized protein (TIGR03663 family)